MSSKRGHHDVIVVGAGAAGLACAFDLAAAGLDVRVLESSDAVGGRMRTDHRDGFLLDRGFQVLNTSYPQLRGRAALRSLRPHPFTPSVLTHTAHGRLRYSDPSRRPRDLPALARPGKHAVRDGAGLAALSLLAALAPPRALRARTERTTSEEPGRLVCTYYYTAPDPPLHESTLLLDSQRRFLNACVPSQAAPGRAPRGHTLVSASVLGAHTPRRARALREALAEAYGTDASGWEEIARYSIPGALPAMVPPRPLSRTAEVGAGRYVCGDHRATGSVQGALASGARAAREVLVSGPP